MNEKELCLQRIEDFLTNEITTEQLAGVLERVHYCYTDMAMWLSYLQQQPICNETVECQYWIARLREVVRQQ